MGKRVCIFVDGENFRHSICDLYPEFRPEDYLPKSAQWENLFLWLTNKVSNGEHVRTYWYVVEHLDFYPHKLKHPNRDAGALEKVLRRDKQIARELDSIKNEAKKMERLSELYSNMKRDMGSMRGRFDGWKVIQNSICTTHPRIEFRRAGSISYSLFDGSLSKEKAVDVKLASDLIMMRDIYDVAILLSGDQDYVPAVGIVKDSGKHVVNAHFRKRNGELLPGGAWRLNIITDDVIQVPYDDLRAFLGMPVMTTRATPTCATI
jgi:uncharacterized LabA/DUF88 family protein